MDFVKWSSIGRFSDTYHNAQYYGTERGVDISALKFRGKIKLHGTNAAIRVSNHELTGQKRTRDISIDQDNQGFAKWLSTIECNRNGPDQLIFFGEWAGSGVRKGDAVSGIGDKKFFVFAVCHKDAIISRTMPSHTGEPLEVIMPGSIISDPQEISTLVTGVFGAHPDFHVLPWHGDEIPIDFTNEERAKDTLSDMDRIVNDVIGKEDPYIRKVFGVSGRGEGLVFYPMDPDLPWDSFTFKVKTEIHSVNKSRTRNHVVPEKPEHIDDFIGMFFTEQRFEQMLDDHFNGIADRKNTGEFIRTVMEDIEKESINEMELADFDWNQARKYGTLSVRDWFLNRDNAPLNRDNAPPVPEAAPETTSEIAQDTVSETPLNMVSGTAQDTVSETALKTAQEKEKGMEEETEFSM